jgi:hypothetical protein
MNINSQKQESKINFEKLRKLAEKIKKQTEEEATKYPQHQQALNYGTQR